MPIYAYRCEACGFTKDALQKVSDAPLTVCPSCNQASFKKQLTAAGFQLKGTGWYVTDFRGGSGNSGNTSTAPATSNADTGAGSSTADSANTSSAAPSTSSDAATGTST